MDEAGQKVLIADLESLLALAKAGEFGDFTSTKFAAPKLALADRLQDLRQNVINGKYD